MTKETNEGAVSKISNLYVEKLLVILMSREPALAEIRRNFFNPVNANEEGPCDNGLSSAAKVSGYDL